MKEKTKNNLPPTPSFVRMGIKKKAEEISPTTPLSPPQAGGED
jgi:hypothetical protein